MVEQELSVESIDAHMASWAAVLLSNHATGFSIEGYDCMHGGRVRKSKGEV